MLVGCATISGRGITQPLSVVALASDGSEVESVKCDMSNDESTWYVGAHFLCTRLSSSSFMTSHEAQRMTKIL